MTDDDLRNCIVIHDNFNFVWSSNLLSSEILEYSKLSFGHVAFPLQYYWNQTHSTESSNNKPFLVVRQEHLHDDMNRLEEFLKGSQTIQERSSSLSPPKWRPTDSQHFTTGRVSATLSWDARRNVCCTLRDEFRIYHMLINRAENLDALAIQETSQEDLRVCSVGSWQELVCPPWNR